VVSDEREVGFAADLRDRHRALLEGVGASVNLVAGACFVLIVRRSSTSPISIAAKSGVRKFQIIMAGDTR
jgi:hypothetical protein